MRPNSRRVSAILNNPGRILDCVARRLAPRAQPRAGVGAHRVGRPRRARPHLPHRQHREDDEQVAAEEDAHVDEPREGERAARERRRARGVPLEQREEAEAAASVTAGMAARACRLFRSFATAFSRDNVANVGKMQSSILWSILPWISPPMISGVLITLASAAVISGLDRNGE